MKKLLALFLVIVLMLSFSLGVSAAENSETTYENYYAGDYRFEQEWLDKYADLIFSEYETHRVYGYRELYTNEEEGWTLIEASNLCNLPWEVSFVLDDLLFYPLHDAPPFKTGYAVYEDGEFKDITEIDLDNYSGIKDELVKCEEVTRIDDTYYDDVQKSAFEDYLNNKGYGPSYEGEQWYVYSPSLYKYYSESNETITPDWILGFGMLNMLGPSFCYCVFGDYCVRNNNYLTPYEFGIHIYKPAERKFYTLEEAWEQDFENIEKAFTDYLCPTGFASYIGDADGDGELSILDATEIQLVMANKTEFSKNDTIGAMHCYGEELEYISDMDRDGERTILDATAIQLKIAQLDAPKEYDTTLVYERLGEYVDMPQNAKDVSFETKLSQRSYRYDFEYRDYGAIVKTKEQLDELLPKFDTNIDEEFFEDDFLVASNITVYSAQEVAEITKLSVVGDTLYIAYKIYSNSTVAEPITPPYINLLAVDKDDVAGVKNIEWVNSWLI